MSHDKSQHTKVIAPAIVGIGIGVLTGAGIVFCASALGLGVISSAPVLATAIGAGLAFGVLTYTVSKASAEKATNSINNNGKNSPKAERKNIYIAI